MKVFPVCRSVKTDFHQFVVLCRRLLNQTKTVNNDDACQRSVCTTSHKVKKFIFSLIESQSHDVTSCRASVENDFVGWFFRDYKCQNFLLLEQNREVTLSSCLSINLKLDFYFDG